MPKLATDDKLLQKMQRLGGHRTKRETGKMAPWEHVMRMKQRDVAHLLGVHEGNVSRQTARLRDACLERIGRQLQALGWTGDDLSGFVLKEMDSLLLDEPRLAADRLAALLAGRGKKLSLGV